MEPRTEKGLGFKPGPVDTRDYRLTSYVEATARQATGSRFWSNPMAGKLDQGEWEGCVGWSWTNLYNSAPKTHHKDDEFALTLYKLATTLDAWEGDWQDYSGTSIRAGAKAAKESNLIIAYAFSYSLEEMALWLLNKGPLVIGIPWTSDLERPDAKTDYFVKPGGTRRSYHAICVDGCRYYGNDNDYFRLLNSWNGWGYGGRCRMEWKYMAELFSDENATACTAVEV